MEKMSGNSLTYKNYTRVSMYNGTHATLMAANVWKNYG